MLELGIWPGLGLVRALQARAQGLELIQYRTTCPASNRYSSNIHISQCKFPGMFAGALEVIGRFAGSKVCLKGIPSKRPRGLTLIIAEGRVSPRVFCSKLLTGGIEIQQYKRRVCGGWHTTLLVRQRPAASPGCVRKRSTSGSVVRQRLAASGAM